MVFCGGCIPQDDRETATVTVSNEVTEYVTGNATVIVSDDGEVGTCDDRTPAVASVGSQPTSKPPTRNSMSTPYLLTMSQSMR